MAISKIMASLILFAAVHTSQADTAAGPGMMKLNALRASETMMAAKGWPPIASKCGLHDFYAKVSTEASEVIADCSVKGDIRGDSVQLKQCLEECCGIENCVGISARATGAKLVQSFVYAHPDNSADSYMLHEISQMVLGAGKGSEDADSQMHNDNEAFTVSSVMANARGFPPMAAQCGRHDFYGEIGVKASVITGDCTVTGDIRDNFHKLQRCINECCDAEKCVGITTTAEGTKFVQSFAEAEADEASNSYMLNPKHRKSFEVPKLTSKSTEGVELQKAGKAGVAAAMTRVKSWPSVQPTCGKVYDFYGGIGGKASAELEDCLIKGEKTGDIRKEYSRLKQCMQTCCETDKCVGITASAEGTKLIESFAAVDEDDGKMSYMQQ